ncbi:E3 ubiquitin/ISG15 ligase TRIM25-like isoform X1 [Alosa sapidissima]|uniref:E3 ubiquitin/ISG15 ligase TRIM25-like isoform X1 n=1 Tax=Alosa sapidissima TaxID=34773 RepID=UPI001C091632|nr:E3 ubiquitin/ISG15 ligase TRIM25-like isoform X1 [Alosa sapidissima]
MAEAISNKQELFTCSICLDLLKDPVTLNCGHNYCTVCIKDCWDHQEDQKGVYSCPQCKQTFTPRPTLHKNNVVAELVEQLRKTRIQDAASPQSFAGPGDVECDSCTGRKLKAVKSCLVCLVSYCETHLQRHDDLITGKRHNVVDVTGQLQDKICTQHQKLLEVFCRTDQSCVCLLCLMDEHKGHDTVSAATERTEKQMELGENKRRLQQRLQEREKELQDLRKAVETLKSSAQTAVEDSERIFTEMIRSIERRRSEVKELIRAQEKAELRQAEGLQKQLEQEIAELKRRDADLEQLSHTEDHIHFLKTFKSVSDPPQSKDLSGITVNKSKTFETVKTSVLKLKEQLRDICKQEIMRIYVAVKSMVIVNVESTNKDSKKTNANVGFKFDASHLTFNTASTASPTDASTAPSNDPAHAVANFTSITSTSSTGPLIFGNLPVTEPTTLAPSGPPENKALALPTAGFSFGTEPIFTFSSGTTTAAGPVGFSFSKPEAAVEPEPVFIFGKPAEKSEAVAYFTFGLRSTVSDVQADFTEPVTREEFLKNSCHFTLDQNTALRNLHLSEGNRRVEWIAECQSYPDHPERFDEYCQVLCRESVSGRCYWEVEWSGWVYIAVSYKSISRKGVGHECGFGYNDKSWGLYTSSSFFRHNNKQTKLPLVASSRIGVYVDHRAGALAFYNISDTMTLLHRVQTIFTHKLYPGFGLGPYSSVKLL